MAVSIVRPRPGWWRLFKRRAPWLPILIIVGTIVASFLGPWYTGKSPFLPSLPNRLLPPELLAGGKAGYLLGTDSLGRDILTRLCYGARISLLVAVFALLLGGGLGLCIGAISGYLRGKVDTILGRLMDSALAFPSILIAILLAVALGPSFWTVIVAIGIVLWARFARVIRGEVLAIREREFIAQAKVDGLPTWRIIVVHIFPNTLNTFMVLASLELGHVILLEATLSFLGAGIPPPTPSWGQMVAEGREFLGIAWWVSLFPGMAICALVFACNLLGDWLRDTLDPKLRQI